MIETLNQKMLVMEEEIKNITERNDNLSKKVLKYEENGAAFLSEMQEGEGGKMGKSGTQNVLHKELIKMSQTLKLKEEMLEKIAKLPDLSDDIKNILEHKQSITEIVAKTASETTEDELKKSIFNKTSELSIFKGKNHTLYMNEEDTNLLINNILEMREQLQYDEKHIKDLNDKIESLSEELREAVQESNPNIVAITNKLADELVNKAEIRYAQEKMQILRDLENRVSKVVQLEIALDESEERFRRLENTMGQGDTHLRKKISKLENQAEQLTVMYHQVVSEKSVLKVDYQVAEKKLKRKDDKIVALEQTLSKLKEQNTSLKKILNGLKILKMRQNDENKVVENNNVTGIPSSGRIVKPLRGGKKEATPRGLTGSQSKLIQNIISEGTPIKKKI